MTTGENPELFPTNTVFNQKKISFTVDAINTASQKIAGVSFNLYEADGKTLDPKYYTITPAPGSTSSTPSTQGDTITITLTEDGWRYLKPQEETGKWKTVTLKWDQAPSDYVITNKTEAGEIVINEDGTTTNAQASLKTVSFKVDAVVDGTTTPIAGVTFNLYDESGNPLPAKYYTIKPSGSLSTQTNPVTITLTQDGYEYIKPGKAVTLKWGNAPANSDYVITNKTDVTVIDAHGTTADAHAVLKTISFPVDAILDGTQQKPTYIAGVPFSLHDASGSQLEARYYKIKSGSSLSTQSATQSAPVSIVLTQDGYDNIETWKEITLKWGDAPGDYVIVNKTDVKVLDASKRTYEAQALLKTISFTVDAVLDGTQQPTYIEGVTFRLVKADGTDLPADCYTIKQGGSLSTQSAPITIVLKQAGYEAIKPDNAGTWKELTLKWSAAPAGYNLYKQTEDVKVVTNKGATQNAEVVLNTWTVNVGSVVQETSALLGWTYFDIETFGHQVVKPGNATQDGVYAPFTLTYDQAELIRKSGSTKFYIVPKSTRGGYELVSTGPIEVEGNGKEVTIYIKVSDKGTGTVSVAKYTKVKDGSWYYIPEDSSKKMSPRNFYVTAFEDAGLTMPARNASGAVIAGTMEVPYSWYTSNSSSSGSPRAVLEGLTVEKTYYLAETTDATNASVVNTDKNLLKIQFSGGATSDVNNAAVTIPSKDAVVPVDLTNTYDKRGLTSAKFQIKLDVVDANNKPLPSTLTATFEVHASNKTVLKPARNIKLANESTKTLSNISYRWNATLYPKLNVVAKMTSLKDASGAEVMKNYNLVNPNKNYAILARGTAITNYTANKYYKAILPEQENQVTLEYTLKKVNADKEIAELKLTKAVTYKKTPIRVNGTYYFGIFQDAAHKKILYKKAMPLSNASSMTSTLKINLYKLADPHTITLYFAEVDKNGKVVQSGKKTGYNITLNKTQVTLSPTHADESVIMTNDVLQGSVAAANLTDPNSGFAGDSSALAEAQALANDDSTKSKKTADDTPFEPFALATGISAGMIFLLLALLMARRKLWVKKK